MILGGNTPDPVAVAELSKTTEKLAAPVTINGETFDGSENIVVPTSDRGAPNGVAPLEDSKVPAAYLPSYVDDVLEFADLASFPGTGESGKIYVAIDTGKAYRWSGSIYVEISASPGSTDAVPEGSTNLYFTPTRALAAAPAETTATEGALISGATTKATPVDADLVGISDSAAGGVLKALSWANIKAALTTLFDGLYYSLSKGNQAVRVLAQSAVANSVTNSQAETTLATYTLPAGTMGLNGAIRINLLSTITNSANTKTIRIKFGGTNFFSGTQNAVASWGVTKTIRNRNSASSQVGFASGSAGDAGAATQANATGTINTAADVTITITAQCAALAETITLEAYSIEFLPGA